MISVGVGYYVQGNAMKRVVNGIELSSPVSGKNDKVAGDMVTSPTSPR